MRKSIQGRAARKSRRLREYERWHGQLLQASLARCSPEHEARYAVGLRNTRRWARSLGRNDVRRNMLREASTIMRDDV
jgi:hypothetical protein